MSEKKLQEDQLRKCNKPTEVYSRICGFYRPVQQWNLGKREEYAQRTKYNVKDTAKTEIESSEEDGSSVGM